MNMQKQLRLWLTPAGPLAPRRSTRTGGLPFDKAPSHPILHLHQAETENFPLGHRTHLVTLRTAGSTIGNALDLDSGRIRGSGVNITKTWRSWRSCGERKKSKDTIELHIGYLLLSFCE